MTDKNLHGGGGGGAGGDLFLHCALQSGEESCLRVQSLVLLHRGL